jgi:acetyltransferase-like isoleucine patch superfamily enzyme
VRVLRDLSAMSEDDRAALAELLRFEANENTRPRTLATISDEAIVSPLASIRFPERVEIGRRSHVGPFCCVWGGWSHTWTRIGADVLLSPGVVLVAGNHGTEGAGPVRDLPFEERDVEIGDGAWIGAHAVIVGCRVGAGAVIGAGSVVLHDIPDLAIAAGTPARVIGSRG